jgi:hypothetical protein
MGIKRSIFESLAGGSESEGEEGKLRDLPSDSQPFAGKVVPPAPRKRSTSRVRESRQN